MASSVDTDSVGVVKHLRIGGTILKAPVIVLRSPTYSMYGSISSNVHLCFVLNKALMRSLMVLGSCSSASERTQG